MIILATLGKHEQMWRNWSFLCCVLSTLSLKMLSVSKSSILISHCFHKMNPSFPLNVFLAWWLNSELKEWYMKNVRIVLKEGEKLQECEFVFMPYEFHSWLQDCPMLLYQPGAKHEPTTCFSWSHLHKVDKRSTWLLQYRYWGWFWAPTEPTASLWKLT